MATTATPVFIDCDNTMGVPGSEIDDGLTILYLLAQPEVEVVGVSTTYGNGGVAVTTRQTRALLDAVAPHVPLFAGASRVGKDGRRSESEAARALVAASQEHAGRLVVLGLGAATNLAGAAELDAEFFGRLGRITLMGGYLAPLRFRSRDVHELNLSCDPQASERVLRAPCPVTVMSAQLCLKARFTLVHLLTRNRGPRWLRRVVREWFRVFSGLTGQPGFYLWDLLPALHTIDQNRFSGELYRMRSEVEDLVHGRLMLQAIPTPRTPEELESLGRAPAIVHVPQRIHRPWAFVRESARSWARAAAPARWSPFTPGE